MTQFESLALKKQWWEYSGDPKLINGGDNLTRYGLVTETTTDAWDHPSPARREPRYWVVKEVADDLNHLHDMDTEQWRETDRFRIYRYAVYGRTLYGRWRADRVVIETGVCPFGGWNQTLQPDSCFDDDNVKCFVTEIERVGG